MQSGFVSRFLRNLAFTGAGTLSQIVFGLMGLLAAVRLVSQEDFGRFILMQVVVMFLIMLGSLLAQTHSITRIIAATGEDRKEDTVLTALNLQFLAGGIITVSAAASIPLVRSLDVMESWSAIIVRLPLLFFLNYLHEQLLGILQGLHRYRAIALAQTANGVARFLCILLFLGGFGWGVGGLIHAFNASFAVSVAIQFAAVPVRKRFFIDRRLALEMVRFGFPLGLNSIFTLAFTRIDRFIVGAMINPAAVAVYEVAARIPDNGYRLFQSFLAVFFPNISELAAAGRHREAERVLNHSLRLVTFLSMLAALAAILFQREIVRILFSERYMESAPVLSILMLSAGFGLVENLLGSTLIAFGHSGMPVKINLVNAVVNILGAVLLIPPFGLAGAAAASLLARAATNPVYVFFLAKAGVRAGVWQYAAPICFLGICGAVFLALGSPGPFLKGLLILLLVALSVKWSVITSADLGHALESIGFRRS